MTKDELRTNIRAQRRALNTNDVYNLSSRIHKYLFSLECIKTAKTVCTFLSAFKEPDTFEIVKRLSAEKKRIAVPVTDIENTVLSLSYISGTNSLIKGAYGIYEPSEIRPVSISHIDALIIPGLAFDRQGNRMGFGKGYYDRLLNDCTCPKIGLCYDFQLFDEIPTEPHDIQMNFIITEKEIITVGEKYAV